MSSHKPQPQSLFDAQDHRRRGDRRRAQARSARAGEEPGDLRHRGRLGRRHGPVRARSRRAQRAGRVLRADRRLALVHGAVRQFRRGGRRRARQGAGRRPAPDAHRHARPSATSIPTTLERPRPGRQRARPQLRRRRAGRGRRHHSRRRRDHRRRRLGQRIGDHRRIRAGDPRGRRRPLGGDRRHDGAVRLDQGAHHRRAGLDLPRPHDRAGRGRRAAEDAERTGAVDPAVRPDADLPDRLRDALAARQLFGDRRCRRPC